MYFNLYNRYIAGEEVCVWKDIYSIKNSTMDENWQDSIKVLQETFERVKFNLDLICNRLINSNLYTLKDDDYAIKYNYESNHYLDILKGKIQNFGYMPLSLELFYKNIEKINFLHSYNVLLPFKYADPLFIDSIKNILDNMSDGSWEELMYENMYYNKPLYIEFSPDYYHKDNISGGLPYGIEITSTQQIDSCVLNTPYGCIYFVEYLRLCFKYGAFPNISNKNRNYKEFVKQLNLGLKNI
jgi:hypothetical protein